VITGSSGRPSRRYRARRPTSLSSRRRITGGVSRSTAVRAPARRQGRHAHSLERAEDARGEHSRRDLEATGLGRLVAPSHSLGLTLLLIGAKLAMLPGRVPNARPSVKAVASLVGSLFRWGSQPVLRSSRQLNHGARRGAFLGLSPLRRAFPLRGADGPGHLRCNPAREHDGMLLGLGPRRQVPQGRLRLHVRPNIAVGSD
jgi:hypothetical protein